LTVKMSGIALILDLMLINLKTKTMKTKFSLLIVALLMLSGCDWFKNIADVTLSTNLTMDIPVAVTGTKAAALNTKIAAYNFSVTQDLSLADNEDVEPYLQKIKSVDLKSLVVTVSGLTSGQTINTISLSVTGVGTICTQTNITSTSNTFTPLIDAALLKSAEDKFKSDKKITVTVSGSTNQAMSFLVNLDFDADIVAGALD
jgi:hypothetical protein